MRSPVHTIRPAVALLTACALGLLIFASIAPHSTGGQPTAKSNQGVIAQAGPQAAPATAAAPPSQSQTSLGPPPPFEVASIKPNTNFNGLIRLGGPDVGHFMASGATLKMLIGVAFGMRDFQILGGPAWINSSRFDIDAKVDDAYAEQLKTVPRPQAQPQINLMLQQLLIDRFQLKVTHATKELPIYALVIAKGGSKLKESTPADAQQTTAQPAVPPAGAGRGGAPAGPMRGGGMRMSANANGDMTLQGQMMPVSQLATLLAQQTGRQVVDQTGLTGNYDFTLEYKSDVGLGGAPIPAATDAAADAGGTSIFTAIQDQLGLKLDSTKGPVDTITIDSIEQPSEN